MQRLIEGVHRFQRETFGNSRELLIPPSHNGQQRPALLITCADAGLLAERISLNRPDGFFCATGLGTFIPPARTTDGNDSDSIVATIEYAGRVLQVGDIIVCGHSSCGAVGALMHGSLSGTSQPHLAWWLERVAPIQDLVRSRYAHLINDAERGSRYSREWDAGTSLPAAESRDRIELGRLARRIKSEDNAGSSGRITSRHRPQRGQQCAKIIRRY